MTEPLTDERILAAVRENARIRAVESGPTTPDVAAVTDYHRIRMILMAGATGNSDRPTVPNDPFAFTAADVAAVERHRAAILADDPRLAFMLGKLDERVRAAASAPTSRARRRQPAQSSPPSPEPGSVRPAIGYRLPKGKHAIFRSQLVAKQWERVTRFLRACTDANPVQPASAGTLLLMETAETAALPRFTTALAKARELFEGGTKAASIGLSALGPEYALPEAARSPMGALFSGGVTHQWNVPPDRLEAAVEVLIAGDPWPRGLVPDATLTVLHLFRWTDPANGVVLPSQSTDPSGGLQSMCITHLGARGSFFPDFVFPFETAGDEFLDYLGRIKNLVPVPLSATHFRLFAPTPHGRLVPRLFDTSNIARVLGKASL